MDKTTELQNLNDNLYKAVKYLRTGSLDSLSFNMDVLESLIDDMRDVLKRVDHVWFDMDSQYYALEDTDRTPMNVKWIKDGVIRLESEDENHVLTGLFSNIEKWATKIS